MPIKRVSRADVDLSKFDWSHADATTEAEVDAQIAADANTAPEMENADGWTVVRNVPVPDVKAIRGKLKTSQRKFAADFGFSARTVQQWEQRRATPEPHTRVFLEVIREHPDMVRAVARAMTKTSGERVGKKAAGTGAGAAVKETDKRAGRALRQPAAGKASAAGKRPSGAVKDRRA